MQSTSTLKEVIIGGFLAFISASVVVVMIYWGICGYYVMYWISYT